MFGFIRHIVHAVAAVMAAGAAAASPVAHPGSVSAGMQAGPVCITQTMHPGDSSSAPVSVVVPAASSAGLSVEQIGPPAGPPYPAGGFPLPASWVSFGGTSGVTVTVPTGAHRGRYGALLSVTNYGIGGNTTSAHNGVGLALGAAAGAWLEISVGVSPPPRAFCNGSRPTYWPWVPVNWCKPGMPVSRADPCTPRPLMPPAASARTCHMTPAAWSSYLAMLRPEGRLRDAHCYWHGHLYQTRAYYGSQHIYRNA